MCRRSYILLVSYTTNSYRSSALTWKKAVKQNDLQSSAVLAFQISYFFFSGERSETQRRENLASSDSSDVFTNTPISYSSFILCTPPSNRSCESSSWCLNNQLDLLHAYFCHMSELIAISAHFWTLVVSNRLWRRHSPFRNCTDLSNFGLRLHDASKVRFHL